MMSPWIGAGVVYLVVLAGSLWLWSRCRCEMRSGCVLDEPTSEALLAALATAGTQPPPRVRGRVRRRRVRAAA